MPIAPIPPLPPMSGASPIAGAGAAGATGAAGAAATPGATAVAGGSNSFSSVLGNAIDSLQQAQNSASVAEANAAAGQGSLTDTMIAASEASLQTQVASAVLNKGLAAYNAIANMTF